MQSFIAELRRRNVLRAAAFYAAAGWLLVQVATQVFPFFHIPEWVVRAIVVAALIGFPFAMLFSWFYELTPEGIKLESEVDRSASITRQTGRALDRWIIAALGLAVVLLLAAALTRRPWGIGIGSAMQVALLATGFMIGTMFLIGALFMAVWLRILMFRHEIVGSPGGARMLLG